MKRVLNTEESLGVTVQLPDGSGLRFGDVLRGELADPPAVGNLKHGLAPRGAKPDLASPEFSFPINTKLEVWADNLADLYEEGNARQWDATRDIRWGELPVLADDLELATAQLMTFLAENEFVAMYLPAKFIPRINPEFTEVVLVLAAQVKDEARHLEVFTKRALANGAGLQQVSPSTQCALKSLLAQEDFSETSFLLHVLGEGTFMELLKFIESHAPDPVTKDIIRRARQDEARHVGYGVQHAGYRISREPEAVARFLKATEARGSSARRRRQLPQSNSLTARRRYERCTQICTKSALPACCGPVSPGRWPWRSATCTAAASKLSCRQGRCCLSNAGPTRLEGEGLQIRWHWGLRVARSLPLSRRRRSPAASTTSQSTACR